MSSTLADARRSQVDIALSRIDGRARWDEILHGAEARLSLNGRLEAQVSRARPAYLASVGGRVPGYGFTRITDPRRVLCPFRTK